MHCWWIHLRYEIAVNCFFTKWKVNLYIGFWMYKVKCNQDVFCGQGGPSRTKEQLIFLFGHKILQGLHESSKSHVMAFISWAGGVKSILKFKSFHPPLYYMCPIKKSDHIPTYLIVYTHLLVRITSAWWEPSWLHLVALTS